MSGVAFYIDNGASANLATNETAVGTFSGTILNYSPNTTLYLIAVALDASPVLNFSYRYYAVPPPYVPPVVPTCTSL